MLNRTNRTLSANTNRLNLGTRKLDQNASANIGTLTLRTAHVDHDVVSVRAVHLVYPGLAFGGPSIKGPKPIEPEILKSKVKFFSRLFLHQDQIRRQATTKIEQRQE